ncbi:MAG: alpha/beta fold hydrolase [Anaerolineae bacterium]
MPSFQADGLRLHYSVVGTGPACLVLAGGPGMDPAYLESMGGLDRFLTLYRLDHRATGGSETPKDATAFSLAHYTADVEAFRMHLGLEEPVMLGHSHGGMIAMQHAIDHPGAAGKLVLVDTAAEVTEFLADIDAAVQDYRHEPWFEDAYSALQKEWAGEYETAEELAEIVWSEMRFYFKTFGDRERAYKERIEHLPVNPIPLRWFNENEVESMDLRPALESVQTPALVVAGRHDFITNVKMAADVAARLPHADLVIFEESGHFPFIEEPERFRAVVRAFVTG